MLVPNGFYLFLPRRAKQEAKWRGTVKAIEDNKIFPLVATEDANRSFSGIPRDTWGEPGFQGNRIGISFCAEDFPTVVAIVRELHWRKRQYRLFLNKFQRQFAGKGDTPEERSRQLIREADAVLAVVSTDYLGKALDASSYVSIEVRTMHARGDDFPVIIMEVDERSKLKSVEGWNCAIMKEKWRGTWPVISEEWPLRYASAETISEAIDEALKEIDRPKQA